MYDITVRGLDTDIYLTRGDTFAADISITDAEGQPYTPAAGDVITFSMAYNYGDTPVVTKTVDDLTLIIESGDTSGLQMQTPYVYDLQITTEGGDIYTFIKGHIFLGGEVS